MGFNIIPIEQALSDRARSELNALMARIPLINEALDKGGWLCGGYARQLMLDQPADEYFRPTRERITAPAGDVDIFFNSVEDAAAATPKGAFRSQAGFAKEIQNFVKVQFVDDPGLIKPTIEETLLSFDIVNCRVAINHKHVVVPVGWRELEASKLLRIGRNDTPFLGGRLLKYLEHRGLEGLTDDSYEMLTGWLAHAAGDFREGGWTPRHIHGAEGHIKRLRERGLVKREDLIFFIGKWKQIFRERTYGQSFTHEVDWALHEMTIGDRNSILAHI